MRTVLLVEDNTEIIKIEMELLPTVGYQVIPALSAESAIEMLDSRSNEVDIVFSDISLSGQNGLWLAQQVKEKYPGLPVVLTTGYSRAAAQTVSEWLIVAKPYTTETLKATFDRILQHPKP